jgi:hypothetical protein
MINIYYLNCIVLNILYVCTHIWVRIYALIVILLCITICNYILQINKYIHTYHSRFISEGVAEASQIFLRHTHVLPKLAMRNTADVTGGKPIAVLLQYISGISAINPLLAFYDIHGGKREVLFFYFVPDTTRDKNDK